MMSMWERLYPRGEVKKAVLNEPKEMIREYLDEDELEASVKYHSRIDERIEKLEKQAKRCEKRLKVYN
ncbi:hypothetical protein [Aneurinibacillus aneurinilyticus]|uniref:Uncharacterized protein n=2 Tax=Aneurinibacillus aneurinilyticus TaxID=1391 RepID=A0A848D1L1_ANEAE|nr:hypothetical protein [Aneurinibacillus aneurinilyticus]NMF01546.1 hypothetical protein [Aneurinibacillus aneurinilyticus]